MWLSNNVWLHLLLESPTSPMARDTHEHMLSLMHVHAQVRVRYQPWMDAETVSDPSYKAPTLYPHSLAVRV